jgi:hypothetical protein
MWLTAFDSQRSPPMLSFSFREEVEITGLICEFVEEERKMCQVFLF